MIKYDPGRTGLFFIIRWKGSVFPKALVWAVPNALLACLLHYVFRSYRDPDIEPDTVMSMNGVNLLWSGYTSVLGFLVVFRNNQAYTRFWEGATLINQVRGEWFNAVSTLFAFCNHADGYQRQVDQFQHTLVRLASMLYCSALQQVCDLEDDTLEIIENAGMDPAALSFMQECNDRCEIILQWMQRLIVDSEEAKTLKIAPPLLTRAFQELSRGIVNLNNARKIKDIPFPFPYAQMITSMLIVHWFVTPLLAAQMITGLAVAGTFCFFVTFSFWCLIYIALEIDQPFGEDANDLPLREMQRDFNQSMLNLMHPLAQKVPSYQAHGFKATVSNSDVSLPGRNSRVLSGDALDEDGSPRASPLMMTTMISEGVKKTLSQRMPGLTSPTARSSSPNHSANYKHRDFDSPPPSPQAAGAERGQERGLSSEGRRSADVVLAERSEEPLEENNMPLEPKVQPVPAKGTGNPNPSNRPQTFPQAGPPTERGPDGSSKAAHISEGYL